MGEEKVLGFQVSMDLCIHLRGREKGRDACACVCFLPFWGSVCAHFLYMLHAVVWSCTHVIDKMIIFLDEGLNVRMSVGMFSIDAYWKAGYPRLCRLPYTCKQL